MEAFLIGIAILFIGIVFAIGIWLVQGQKRQNYDIVDTEEDYRPPVTVVEDRRNYYGQPVLPEPRTMRRYQTAPVNLHPEIPRVRSTPAPAPVVVHNTVVHTGPDLLDPLNPLSPLSPLNPIGIWNQDRVTEVPAPVAYEEIRAPEYPPVECHDYHGSHANTGWSNTQDVAESWGGGHSDGGAGSSWNSPSSSDSYSSSSYDSGSSCSYD